MEPRDHHFGFAKRDLTSLAFSSFDKMYQELTGPQRDAFLMFLWQESGKNVAQQLRPVDVGRVPGSGEQGVVKLDVVGALQRNGLEIVVLSMPPALAPNEAVFVALTRQQGQVRVFFYERCRDAQGNLSPNECVLSAMMPPAAGQMISRSNFGFFQGDGLRDFLTNMQRVLGVPLDGIEQSLAPVTMEAFVAASAQPPAQPWGAKQPQGQWAAPQPPPPPAYSAAGPQPGGGYSAPAQHPYAPRGADAIAQAYGGMRGAQEPPKQQAYDPYAVERPPQPVGPHPTGVGKALEIACLIRAGLPILSFLTSFVFYMGGLFHSLEMLVTLAMMVMLFIWQYRILDARRGQTRYTPGLAIAVWFIPFVNFIVPPMVMNDVWKSTRQDENVGLITAWWIAWLAQIAVFMSPGLLYRFTEFMPPVVYGLFAVMIGVTTHGLLWLIVRKINEKA